MAKTRNRTRGASGARRDTSAENVPEPFNEAQIPVSGRYLGDVVSGPTSGLELVLRIDLDQRHGLSPVMNRVSGDVFQKFTANGESWKVYRESWIVHVPTMAIDVNQVRIVGPIEFWNDPARESTLEILIPRTTASVGPARVTIRSRTEESVYSCAWQSNRFRRLELKVDVCDSVNQPPLLPSYETHGHNDRPADTLRRTLTIEESYYEAGIDVKISPTHTVIDDSAERFESWSPAELHDVMETQGVGTSPEWKMWGLLAGEYENPLVGGIMFDAATEFGGAGRGPERQGFAVFRNHEWFDDLVAGPPSTQAEQAAARKFLYTWIHEAGHAFNFLHSWDKSRPDSLSWMNYDWRYDGRNGAGQFWKSFSFRFDDEELIHLRHANRAAVIMGGDSWGSGGHLKAADRTQLEMEMVAGKPPLELLLRGPDRFEFMEPVRVELRLRNLTKRSVTIDSNLHPEFGSVTVFIRKPNGQAVEFEPLFCKLAASDAVSLRATGRNGGRDRYSTPISMAFGKHGFYFDSPGIYTLRATAHGPGGSMISSNSLRFQVGFPTREDERLAQDFFTREVGLSLYLGGSQSPSLESGMQVLEEIADVKKESRFGATVAAVIADSISKPFFRMVESKLTQTHTPNLDRANRLFNEAVSVLQQIKDKSVNLVHRTVAEKSAECKFEMGDELKARVEIESAKAVLKSRGVNASVLSEIELDTSSRPKKKPRPKSTPSRPRRSK